MPSGASPRSTSSRAERTSVGPGQARRERRPLAESLQRRLGIEPGRDMRRVAGRQPPLRPEHRGEVVPGPSVSGASGESAGATSTSALPSGLTRVSGRIRSRCGEIVHPGLIGAEEQVGRGALLDLPGQGGGGGEGEADRGVARGSARQAGSSARSASCSEAAAKTVSGAASCAEAGRGPSAAAASSSGRRRMAVLSCEPVPGNRAVRGCGKRRGQRRADPVIAHLAIPDHV